MQVWVYDVRRINSMQMEIGMDHIVAPTLPSTAHNGCTGGWTQGCVTIANLWNGRPGSHMRVSFAPRLLQSPRQFPGMVGVI